MHALCKPIPHLIDSPAARQLVCYLLILDKFGGKHVTCSWRRRACPAELPHNNTPGAGQQGAYCQNNQEHRPDLRNQI